MADPAPASKDEARRTAAFVLGGAGLAALGIGTYFGLRAFALHSEAEELCAREGGCRAEAVAKDGHSKDCALVSTLTIGAALATLGAGAYLYLSSGSTEPVHALVVTPTVGGGAVGYVARF